MTNMMCWRILARSRTILKKSGTNMGHPRSIFCVNDSFATFQDIQNNESFEFLVFRMTAFDKTRKETDPEHFPDLLAILLSHILHTFLLTHSVFVASSDSIENHIFCKFDRLLDNPFRQASFGPLSNSIGHIAPLSNIGHIGTYPKNNWDEAFKCVVLHPHFLT